MTTTELRRLFKWTRVGDATCPLCHEPRLCINHGKNGSTVLICQNCGKGATRVILATKDLNFSALYENNDPRYQRTTETKPVERGDTEARGRQRHEGRQRSLEVHRQ